MSIGQSAPASKKANGGNRKDKGEAPKPETPKPGSNGPKDSPAPKGDPNSFGKSQNPHKSDVFVSEKSPKGTPPGHEQGKAQLANAQSVTATNQSTDEFIPSPQPGKTEAPQNQIAVKGEVPHSIGVAQLVKTDEKGHSSLSSIDIFSDGTLGLTPPAMANALKQKVEESGLPFKGVGARALGELGSNLEDSSYSYDLAVPLGTINATGHYQLDYPGWADEQSGNLFAGGRLTLWGDTDPLTQNLSDAERQFVEKHGFPSMLPESAKQDGLGNPLDGTGVKVLVYDDDGEHGTGVQQIISDIAPGAVVHRGYVGEFSGVQGMSWDPELSIRENQAQLMKKGLEDFTQDLQGYMDKYHPNVVSTSAGNGRMWWARDLVDSLSYPTTEAQSAEIAGDPHLSKIVDSSISEDDKLKAAVEYVDDLFQNHSGLKTSLQGWNDLVKDAAEKNTIFVIAASNEGNYPPSLGLNQGQGIFETAGGPNVITVGSSSPNSTPDLKDDGVNVRSSVGSADRHVTLLAPGNAIVDKPLIFIAPNGNGVTQGGTSFATPTVAGTIALMLQKKPDLTFEEVKSALVNTAVDTPAPVEAEGAGVLDPIAALNAVSLADPEQ